MKALKYGLTLVLGLSMLGWNARVQAQTQTQTESQNEEQPQRGIPTPKAIETLVDSGDYETAVKVLVVLSAPVVREKLSSMKKAPAKAAKEVS